ncbi:MAG: glycoside hydrolase family 19 protein [Proteobacteria bacterium]|nr:glycoside hydrolase family 19 protein [Pseudomonadota bacterium]
MFGKDIPQQVLSAANSNAGKLIDLAAAKTKLAKHVPQSVLNELDICIEKFSINTDLRIAHFLGQCCYESSQFTRTSENLHYTTQERILAVFPKYFKKASAAEYTRNPEKLGSKVYANRLGNGDEESKDGYKYRGRGYIQLTGKSNYNACSMALLGNTKLVDEPDLVSAQYALTSAAYFWTRHKLNETADKGNSAAVLQEITMRVNGGTRGLQKRIKHFNHYYAVLLM